MRFAVRRFLQVQVLVALLGLAAPAGFALDNSDCFACHGDTTLTKTDAAGKTVSLFVDEARFNASIHAKNLCTSCHADITDLPHPDHFTAKPVSCSQCHRIEAQIYLNSDHGQAVHKGVQEAASCKDCHGSNHYLLNHRDRQSPVYRTNLPQTCGRCHGNVARDGEVSSPAAVPHRQLRKQRPRHCLAPEGRNQCRRLHRLSRVARPAPVHQPRLQALLAECP